MSESGTQIGIAQLPGFEASLRLLVERERYALTDIASMFGVSRERIRQLCDRFEIVHPDARLSRGSNALRLWHDEENCFRPEPRGVVYRHRASGRRVLRESRRMQRRARLLAALGQLRASLNREPRWTELHEALGLRSRRREAIPHNVLREWSTSGDRHAKKLKDFCVATGYTPHRPSGFTRAMRRLRSSAPSSVSTNGEES